MSDRKLLILVMVVGTLLGLLVAWIGIQAAEWNMR